MPRTAIAIAAAVAAALAPGLAAAEEAADAGAPEEAEPADAGLAEAAPAAPELDEPFLPPEPSAPEYDDAAPQPAEEDGRPFAKGDIEPGVGLAFAGYDGDYYMDIGASFAYYVVDRFAPGLEVSYGTDFGSAGIPDSVTLLPFAKFVILRSAKFAPYLIALGGRQFEFNGYNAVHSWIVGGGAGAHIGFGEHVAMRLQVTFQHHWYDSERIRVVDDGSTYTDEHGNEYACPFDGGCDWSGWVHPYDAAGDPIEDTLCLAGAVVDGAYPHCVGEVHDKPDLPREWIFPIISIGMAFSF